MTFLTGVIDKTFLSQWIKRAGGAARVNATKRKK